MPRLSICIPTYNRSTDLIANLSSLAEQLTAEMDIVISNNASTDDTAEQLEQWKQQHPTIALTVVNQPTNLGFDRNVLAVMAAAQGDYCWLLSDDDRILPMGLQRILQLINTTQQPAYLVNYQRFDDKAKRVTAERMIALAEDIQTTDVNEFYFMPTPLPSYFQVLGTNMITMSVNVVQRSAWNAVLPNIQQFIGLNFIHVFALGAILLHTKQAYYVAEPLVQYTSNHHRAWNNDIWADYKAKFLQYLGTLGYDSEQVVAVQQSTINHRTEPRFMLLLSRFRDYLKGWFK